MTSHLGCMHIFSHHPVPTIIESSQKITHLHCSDLFLKRSVAEILCDLWLCAKNPWRFLRIVVFPHRFLGTSTAFDLVKLVSDRPGLPPPSLTKFHDFNPTRHGATGFESHERLRKKTYQSCWRLLTQDFNEWLKKQGNRCWKFWMIFYNANLFECVSFKHFNDCSKCLTSGF